jgi:regulator of ribosome biosynthesis
MARRKAGTLKSKRDDLLEEEEVEEEEEVSTSASDVAEDEEESTDDNNSEEEKEEDASSDVQSEEEDEEEMDNSSASSEDEHSDGDNESDDVNADTLVQSEHCTFDLGNLLAFNTHQVNSAELYNSNKKNNSNNNNNNNLNKEWYDSKSPTIEITNNNALPVNESVLLAKAAEGTTQLLRELWKLPTEKTDLGLLAKLPVTDTKLPRMLPPPPPKQLTKWEQFALQRGIAPKGKRSRKVYDESTGEWKHLTGSLDNKANAGPESWPILEVKKNDDPYQDPWEKLREEKKGRVTKNTESRMRNAERSGSLEKGTANKMMKNVKKQERQRELMRQKERESGLVAPVGVPVDMMKGGGDATRQQQQRGKPSTQLALKATQVSTASLGRFDKQIEGEPERQLKKNVKRRKLDPTTTGNTNKKYLQTEVQKSQDILSKVMNGSTKEKDRDVKKGRYAKGETAYDYDFDDGLGAGSFKKKKGRAGAGKMKKLTKARIK